MFELIKQVWIENVDKLANRVVYFARGSTCTRKFRTGSVNVEDLVKRSRGNRHKNCIF